MEKRLSKYRADAQVLSPGLPILTDITGYEKKIDQKSNHRSVQLVVLAKTLTLYSDTTFDLIPQETSRTPTLPEARQPSKARLTIKS